MRSQITFFQLEGLRLLLETRLRAEVLHLRSEFIRCFGGRLMCTTASSNGIQTNEFVARAIAL